MKTSIGIVGFPNVGKSTLFNALLAKTVSQIAPYPFCTIEPHHGMVPVPDKYLEKLALLAGSREVVPAFLEFVDIAGLVKNAHQGAGLGNQFLSYLRGVGAILFLLRAFDNGVPREDTGKLREDLKILKTELLLSDLQMLERLVKSKKQLNIRPKIKALITRINQEEWVGAQISLPGIDLLVNKPYFVVINAEENSNFEEVKKKYSDLNPIVISAKTELELSQLPLEERRELQKVGLSSFLDQVIQRACQVLDLAPFYTIKGGHQVKAWLVKRGTSIRQAAKLVHSDFEKYFVRAEVIEAEKLLAIGSWEAAKAQGVVRVVGEDYLICSNEVVEFKISR